MDDDLVRRWIQYHAEGSKTSDPLFTAWEEVTELISRDPEAGWQVILELVASSPDDAVLANVAAGPLEDLITKWPGRVIERIEAQARRDPKFRRSLTGVWGIPPSIEERITKYTSTIKDPL